MWYVVVRNLFYFFFFSSRRRHTRCGRDWSQTCALPIFYARSFLKYLSRNQNETLTNAINTGTSTNGPITPAKAWPELRPKTAIATAMANSKLLPAAVKRSEERRVGKERQSGSAHEHERE